MLNLFGMERSFHEPAIMYSLFWISARENWERSPEIEACLALDECLAEGPLLTATPRGAATIEASWSTDPDQRNLFAQLITGGALGVRIERGLAINDKQVLMMTVSEGNFESPGAVDLAIHRTGCRIPIIEVAHDVNLFRYLRVADERNRFNDLLCRNPVKSAGKLYRMHALALR
jgi:hypothetical protein